VATSLAIGLMACSRPASPTADATAPAQRSAPAADAYGQAGDADTAPATAGIDPVFKRMRAHGNEPFWAIEVDGDALVYKTPELMGGHAYRASTLRTVDGGVEFAGQDAGKAFALVVTAASCSDGMSDRTFDYTAVWTLDGQRMQGCAEALR